MSRVNGTARPFVPVAVGRAAPACLVDPARLLAQERVRVYISLLSITQYLSSPTHRRRPRSWELQHLYAGSRLGPSTRACSRVALAMVLSACLSPRWEALRGGWGRRVARSESPGTLRGSRRVAVVLGVQFICLI